jgi:hypothetical protein
MMSDEADDVGIAAGVCDDVLGECPIAIGSHDQGS